MTPDQRARALRLADGLSSPMGEPGVTGWATMMDAANLLRELAAEPDAQDAPVGWVEPYALSGLKNTVSPDWCCIWNNKGSMRVPVYAAPQPARVPMTDEFVYRVVRSEQPDLSEDSKAWKALFAECRYWLNAAHGITGDAK